MDAGTYYEEKEIEATLKQVFALIKNNQPGDAESLLNEFGLREWVCGSD